VSLVQIQNAMLAEDRLSVAFARADAHYGGRLVITTPYGAYRSRADQQYLRNRYLSDPKRYPYAAPPGNSWHERGLAVDIANWAMFPDLEPVMKSYGFKRDALEDWHYNYVGGGSAVADYTSTPIGTNEDVVTAAEIDAIAERTAAKVIREYWIGNSDPMNRPLDQTLYELVVNLRSAKTTSEQVEKAIAALSAKPAASVSLSEADRKAIIDGVVAKLPTSSTADPATLAKAVAAELAARLAA
jgi:hypothetical protein